MPIESRFVAIGAEAPNFALPAVNGETVELSRFRGEKAVVLVFLRGFL